MPFRRVRFSLAQLALIVLLAAILVSVGLLLWQTPGTPEYWASAVAFSPDGKTVAASLYVFHEVQIWQPTPRVLGADASHSFLLLGLPDLYEDRVLERTTRPGRISVAWPVRKMGLGQSLAFSPDGTMLATKGMDNTVSIWNVGSRQKIDELSTADELSGGLSWADDGTLAASGANACYVLRANSPSLQKLTLQRGSVSAVLSRDGSKLATADDDGKIELWDAHSASRLHQLDAGEFPFAKPGLAISPDGQLIAGGIAVVNNSSAHGAARVWTAGSGEELFTWEIPLPVLAVTFSPDATTLAASGADGKLHFFSLNGGEDVAIDADAFVAAVAFSPDGTLLVTGDSRGRVSLWDVNTKTLLRQISLHHESAFPHGLVLIAASMTWVVSWIYVGRRQKSRLSQESRLQ